MKANYEATKDANIQGGKDDPSDAAVSQPRRKGNACLSCCCTTSRCALVCWTISSVLWLSVSVALITICFFARDTKPPTPCHGVWGPVAFLHRGNLTTAQENTAEATMAGVTSGIFSEMDVLATSDGVPHLFHDKSMLRMTGIERNFADVSSSELANGDVILQAVIDGHDYGQTNLIPQAENVIRDTCNLDSNSPIDIDVKDSPSAEKLVDILATSGCNVGTPASNIIFAIGDPTVGNNLQEYRTQTPEVQVRTSLFLHPNSYGPIGLYFFLKTRLLHWYSKADMISAHYTVWDQDYDVIQQYEQDGYCSAVYGIRNTPEEIARYPTASYYVVDEGPYFPDNPDGGYGGDGSGDVTYDGERGGYIALVTLGFLGIPIFLLSAYMTYRSRAHCTHCCCGRCAEKDSRVQYEVVGDKEAEGEEAGGTATLY